MNLIIPKFYSKPLFIILLILFLSQSIIAQDSFRSARIGWENASNSPYDIRFTSSANLTKETFFNEYKSYFNLTDDYSFKVVSRLDDNLGELHYRVNQYYRGIEVSGAQFILHEKNGIIFYANGHLVHDINIEVNPSLTETAALQFGLQHINANRYMWQDFQTEEFLKKEQNDPSATFYPAGKLILTTGREVMKSGNVKLAYRFDIYAQEPLGRYYVDVDANSGEVINVISRINHNDVPGTGVTNYNGEVGIIIDSFIGGYRLRELSRGNGIETYNMNNGTNYSQATDFVDADTSFTDSVANAGVSAHWAIEGAYDYYLNEHGLNSVNGNGFVLRSYIHYSNGYFNAFWDGQRMTFGDGAGNPLVSIDISAHEMTHGVTQYSAGLIYQNEPGALNESFSDVFGTAVEFYLEGPTANWLIAEDVGTFRSMQDPKAYNNPDTYKGDYWVPAGGPDNGGVHTNSGVQNHWFYLLTEGGSGINDNGHSFSVSGIGLEDASKIAYRNLSVYLTPPSSYFDARLATINSAADLFGSGSQQYLSALDAWYAVGVYQPYLTQRTGVSADSLNFLAEVSAGPDSDQLQVSNIGLQPLTISDIQISGTGFSISSLPSLPMTLNNYQEQFSLEILFSPTAPGTIDGTVSITSDDPEEPVKTVYLKGKAFTITPASERILYASSGPESSGKIITIDLLSGQGSEVGLSQFEEIKSIAIHPVTKIIYGMVVGNSDVRIVRVNAEEGDAYTLHAINLTSMAGMAFDNSGILYGTSIFGDIYSIDLSNGTYNLVVDANTSVSGITFHPVTNELWASSRGFVGPNKDKIFTIDLGSGDITLIGHTGLSFMTNDIVFNESLKLYGLIGGAGQVSDLVQINTSTGEGTIVGSTGFENVLGLAYLTGEISSVENDLPAVTIFALEQNYPNPFNPSTIIKFQLPEKSMVTLKVYNLIGEEIATLVNEELPFGVYEKKFDASNLTSGIYFYSLKADGGSKLSKTNKMILLK